MLHRFCPAEHAETAHWKLRGIFEIEQILKREFFEAGGDKGGALGAGKRPGHLALGIGGFAATGDREQKTTGTEESGDIFNCSEAKGGRQNLEGVGLRDKMEGASPFPQELGVRFIAAGFAGGAGFTVKSAVRMTVSSVSRSIAVTSMVYRPGTREATGMRRSIVSCSPP
jgi:hypothetical protein